MNQCHICNNPLSDAELAAGRCENCGVDLPAGSVGSSKESRTRSRVFDSQLTVNPRLLSRPGDSTLNPSLRADYEIVRELGKGGMGVDWLAHQTSLGREVAIKQIKEDVIGGGSDRTVKSARQSFQFEAVVIANLNHPNIVPIYDMGADADGNLLYSMKSVTGVSWDRLIETYSEADNIEILMKVSGAIAFAHSRGIVHRDLKPSSIMVGSFDEVLVMDWSTALPLAQFKSPLAGTVANLAGTPAYMSPEQARGVIADIGPHSDVYLLGAILFEIVAGIPPHPMSSETGESFTVPQLLENAKANLIVHTSASGELLEIAIKAMHTSPRDRYASVEKLIVALKNYQMHAERMVLAKQVARLRNLRITAAVLLVVVFVGGAIAGLLINNQTAIAVAAAEEARISRDEAIASKKKVAEEKAKALAAADVAVKAKNDAEKAEKALQILAERLRRMGIVD